MTYDVYFIFSLLSDRSENTTFLDSQNFLFVNENTKCEYAFS